MAQTPATLCSAAHRHLRDAAHLNEQGEHQSPDQAWHLAGLSIECSVKALLASEDLHKKLGHEFATPGLVELYLTHSPLLAGLPVPVEAAQRSAWRPADRYAPTGTHAQGATELVRRAERTWGAIAAALWATGLLEEAPR